MSRGEMLVPQYVVDDWLAALKTREPRALELARALTLSLPDRQETRELQETWTSGDQATPFEIANEVAAMLEDSYAKYEAFRHGAFERVDVGNPNVLAFERTIPDERLLIVSNLARVPQPVKFRDYAGRAGWDILNRVEFTFPARAQLEAYEFLWLLVE